MTLDHISTSQKFRDELCPYGAPIGGVVKDGKATLYQTCCNHWTCPVCSPAMASRVQARAIFGANMLAEVGCGLYFWTFTCRGRDLDLATSDEHYYEWTNKALSRLRYQAKRDGSAWIYVQVTERQQRGAAHSHFIHTFCPSDARPEKDQRGRTVFQSSTFKQAIMDAGLGSQSHLTQIDEPGAVAAYVSGYVKKHLSVDLWPAKWKRVRWSRDWPDLPEPTFEYAAVALNQRAWDDIDQQHMSWETDNLMIAKLAKMHMVSHVDVVKNANMLDKAYIQAYADGNAQATSPAQ